MSKVKVYLNIEIRDAQVWVDEPAPEAIAAERRELEKTGVADKDEVARINAIRQAAFHAAKPLVAPLCKELRTMDWGCSWGDAE